LKKIVEGGAPAVDEAEWQESQPAEPVSPSSSKSIRQSKDDLYAATLAKYDGKVKPAAEELEVSERTIYRWLAERKKK